MHSLHQQEQDTIFIEVVEFNDDHTKLRYEKDVLMRLYLSKFCLLQEGFRGLLLEWGQHLEGHSKFLEALCYF